jgi:hypothetical protein
MLDLEQSAVINWLNAIDPERPGNAWPPAVRPVEQQADAPALLTDLGRLLDGLGNDGAADLGRELRVPTVSHQLRDVIAQLGAARLFRLLHWLGELEIEGSHLVVAALIEGDAQQAQALRIAILAHARRVLLGRIFAPERLAALRAATETALQEID